MKYLIEIHHGIGDIVQMMSVVECILQYDAKAYIAIILNKDQYKELFSKDDRISAFFRIDLKIMTKLQILKEVKRMRKEHFDYFFLSPISNGKASRILAWLVGAQTSVGEQLIGRKKSWRYIETEDVHIVRRNFNLLTILDNKMRILPPRLSLNDVEVCINIKKKTIGLCIGTSIPQKTWKLSSYLNIAEDFIALGYDIVFLGGEKEASLMEDLSLSDGVIDLTGKLSLIQSAKVASKCCLIVGGDTGIMHMAAAVGGTTLTLFSCTDPRLHCPYSDKSYFYNIELPCQYCYERGEVALCQKHRCINEIEVEKVKDLMVSILGNVVDNKFKFYDNAFVR